MRNYSYVTTSERLTMHPSFDNRVVWNHKIVIDSTENRNIKTTPRLVMNLLSTQRGQHSPSGVCKMYCGE